jgi:SEC-C motif domain protein
MNLCPCGSNLNYDECCEPIIKGAKRALTAEALMRSRYSAYVKQEIQYLHDSLHPDFRKDFDMKATAAWAASSEWQKLEIINTIAGGIEDEAGQVEFVATYKDKAKSVENKHHELSRFKKKDGVWYFVDGGPAPVQQYVRATPKVGRNDPCLCGSGKKFKKCCGK